MEPIAQSREPRKETGRTAARSPPRSRLPRGVSRPSSTAFVLLAVFIGTVVLCQGSALGSTSVTTHAPAQYAVMHFGAPAAAPATVTATVDRVATARSAGYPPAGTQLAGTVGLAGTPTAIPACPAAACTDRYIVASPAGLTVGNYAERVTLTLTQPLAPPGVSKGFLVEVLVHTTTEWVVGRAYLATGTTAEAGGATITLLLYLNLGTAAAPTILGVQTVVDLCSTATVCP